MPKQAIIIGGGNSVRAGITEGLWDKIRDKDVWSLNSVYKAMPYLPTKQLWVDADFFSVEVDKLQTLHDKGVHLVSRNQIRVCGLKEFIETYDTSTEPTEYYGKLAEQKKLLFRGRMGLCGVFALSYAVAKCYDEIFLLGYDFGAPTLYQRATHWYQDQIQELDIYSTGAGRPEVYLNKAEGPGHGQTRAEIDDFAVYLKETDIKIWNVSEISHIPYFPKISYTEFFEKLK